MSYYKGIAYRVHKPEWANDATSGIGAKIHGGRFNRPGIDTLYLALTRDGAFREANQGFKKKESPSTIVSYEVDCADLVDLRSMPERRKWNVTLTQLGGPWITGPSEPPATWRLADLLISKGYAGIFVRSFAPGAPRSDTNLVLWKWGPGTPHKVVAYDPEGRLTRISRKSD